ncbi:hypothetical protein NMG60_11012731 [Bertholletia excelsa]
MDFLAFRALLLVKLSLLLLSCFTAAYGPTYPPAQPPNPPKKSNPPAQAPYPPKKSPPPATRPPHIPPPAARPSPSPAYPLPKRKLLAVQGVVYCKSCKYPGVETLLGATPLQGAKVTLQCNNTKYQPMRLVGTTDKNGYFFIMGTNNITTFASHKCRVFLLSSPVATCKKPTDLHCGQTGAALVPSKPPQKPAVPPLPFDLFTVGPFAFEPPTKCQL